MKTGSFVFLLFSIFAMTAQACPNFSGTYFRPEKESEIPIVLKQTGCESIQAKAMTPDGDFGAISIIDGKEHCQNSEENIIECYTLQWEGDRIKASRTIQFVAQKVKDQAIGYMYIDTDGNYNEDLDIRIGSTGQEFHRLYTFRKK
jgi:hypothetical protein